MRIIIPYVMRVLASSDPQGFAEDLLELCVFDAPEIAMKDELSPTRALMRGLWDDRSLNSLRVRYVLALWAAV